jgi:hypothetical protein
VKLVSGAEQYRTRFAQHVIGGLDRVPKLRPVVSTPRARSRSMLLSYSRNRPGMDLISKAADVTPSGRIGAGFFQPPGLRDRSNHKSAPPSASIPVGGVRRNVVVSSAARCSPARTFSFFSVSAPSVSTI